MGVPSTGALVKLCFEPTTGTFDTSSEPYEILSETLSYTEEHLDTNGIRGTRSHAKERVRVGAKNVAGAITLNPSPADLTLLLPRILGTAESSDTFALAETLPTFKVLVDRGGRTHDYSGCYVSRASFRSAAPAGLLELTLDIIGTNEALGTSYPVLTLGTAAKDAPYVHSDATFTLAGNTEEVIESEIIIDNQLTARHTNAQVAGAIISNDRIVTASFKLPYSSDEIALYPPILDGAAGGFAGIVAYVIGNMNLTFTFGKLQAPAESPTTTGREEITLTLICTARSVGSTKELVVVNDDTV